MYLIKIKTLYLLWFSFLSSWPPRSEKMEKSKLYFFAKNVKNWPKLNPNATGVEKNNTELPKPAK